MQLRRTARTSALSLALVAGLALPPAAWSTPDPPPDQPDQSTVELAEELGYELDDPELATAAEQEREEQVEAFGATATQAPGADDDDAAEVFAEESETGLWLVGLEADPLATYEGDVRGLSATSVRASGQDRLDVTSAESTAYLEHLQREQARALTEMAEELGHEVEVDRSYRYAFNGVAIRATAEEAEALAALPGVTHVEPEQIWELETDVSNEILGSPAIWDGQTGPALPTRGEGVITGMIDSGVNPEHPSFAATDAEGYTHTNPLGEGTYLGVCAEDANPRLDLCNDKLIGVHDFTGTGAVDTNGHGSHVGGTMAGNAHDAVFTVGETEFTRPVAGVAPRANVISYKACGLIGCASSHMLAAVDQAIADGTDVLNFSISGPDNPWANAVDQAFLAAFEAGIYVAASAGNTGPNVGTVTKTAPWNATVAAANSPRLIAQGLAVTGPEPVPGQLEQMAAVPGSGPDVTEPLTAPLREVASNVRGCTAFPAGAFDDALALIERGDCDFSVKVNNAAAAGALGVVVTNQIPGPPVVMGGLEATTVPVVMTSREDGVPLREFVREHGDVEVLLDSAAVLSETPEWAGIVTDFSGRGPSRFNLLNPTFTAPGRNILAATAAADGDPVQYEFMQGTSMSSPHGAGSGALLRALHPEWSPAMIRSALASTADPEGMRKEDGVTPADAFDVGSGMLDLDAAGRVGLVMDETHANFVAANPATGGDPRTLNLPSVMDNACADVCTFERTVTSVADTAATYTVTASGEEGMQVGVEPASFTIAPGATQVLTVTVDVTGDTAGGWLMGSVALATDGAHDGGAAISDVHYPVAALAANPAIDLAPEALSSTLGVDEEVAHEVIVRNRGTAPLDWAVTQEGADCTLPAWVNVAPTEGTVAPGETEPVTVTFDTTDLAGGTYEATLCIASNALGTPVAQVALTLEVVEIPVIEVDPTSVEVEVPVGRTGSGGLTITNTGYGELDWTFADAEAGPSAERVEMLREGVLLAPVSAAPRPVLALSPEDGSLIDDAFIESLGTSGTPLHVLPNAEGTGLLVSDQLRNVIREFDLDGNELGVFAPRGGVNTSVLQNMRGMAWSPEGTLVVTVASGGNANSLVELDTDGTYLGQYVEAGLGGLAGPWFPLFRDGDLLVSANTTSQIHSFSTDGSEANTPFRTDVNWPVQIAETPSGSVLTAVWSTASGMLPAGLHEFGADGELLWSGTVPGANNYGGVYPLGNGNILATTGQGVYQVSRDGTSTQEWAGPRTRFVSEVHLPDLQACQTPDEISWLDVDPVSGSTARNETTDVEVTLDAEGLDAGTHTARLCVSSNDELRPYVPVDVTLTVIEAPACDTTIDGRVNGGLTVTGAVCVEPGAVINGGVTVEAGGVLLMDGARVSGGLTSVDASWVEVTGTRVNGDVHITGTTQYLVFEDNHVTGEVHIHDNPADD